MEAGSRVYCGQQSLRGMGMQVGHKSRPGWLALIMTFMLVAGCGQKGPLYRDDGNPAAQTQTGDDVAAEQRAN